LEINPNCGIFYPDSYLGHGDHILLNEENGHTDFINNMIGCALKREVQINDFF